MGGYGKTAQAGEIESEADTSLEEAAITQETEDTTTSYTDIVAENILDTMTPEKLNSIWQELSGNDTNSKMRELLSMSLERFAEQVRDAEQTQAGTQADMEYNHAAAEHIRNILEGSGEAVDYLLENELTVSANMIDAVRQLSNGGRKFFEKLHSFQNLQGKLREILQGERQIFHSEPLKNPLQLCHPMGDSTKLLSAPPVEAEPT